MDFGSTGLHWHNKFFAALVSKYRVGACRLFTGRVVANLVGQRSRAIQLVGSCDVLVDAGKME